MGDGDRGTHDASQAGACAEEHPRLLAMLSEAVSAGDVFVDVGANTGFFAIPLAKLVGSAGRVLAFEPAADVAEQLRRHARADGLLDRITIYELALGSEDGCGVLRADLGQPKDSTKRSLFISDGLDVGEVPVRSFDGLVDSAAVDLSSGIHAVKIDVEGAEMHVLSGMRQSLERYRPRMIVVETIESHLQRAAASVSDIRSFLRDLGYVVMADGQKGRRLELNTVFVPM
jgi:FkbM family methyltransferase